MARANVNIEIIVPTLSIIELLFLYFDGNIMTHNEWDNVQKLLGSEQWLKWYRHGAAACHFVIFSKAISRIVQLNVVASRYRTPKSENWMNCEHPIVAAGVIVRDFIIIFVYIQAEKTCSEDNY